MKELLQVLAAECVVVVLVLAGQHLDQTRQISEQVALVAVGQDGRDGGVVKFNVVVMDLDKVDVRESRDQRPQSRLDSTGYLALNR